MEKGLPSWSKPELRGWLLGQCSPHPASPGPDAKIPKHQLGLCPAPSKGSSACPNLKLQHKPPSPQLRLSGWSVGWGWQFPAMSLFPAALLPRKPHPSRGLYAILLLWATQAQNPYFPFHLGPPRMTASALLHRSMF